MTTPAAKPGGADHVIVGGCAPIVFENRMGSHFRLRSVHVDLDGTTLLEKTDPPDGPNSLFDVHEMPVFVGQVAPGGHDIHVVLVYVSRAFGIYSYTRNYKFTVRSTQALSITAGRPLQLQIVAYEKGGPMTPIEERPAIRFFVVGQAGSAEGR